MHALHLFALLARACVFTCAVRVNLHAWLDEYSSMKFVESVFMSTLAENSPSLVLPSPERQTRQSWLPVLHLCQSVSECQSVCTAKTAVREHVNMCELRVPSLAHATWHPYSLLVPLPQLTSDGAQKHREAWAAHCHDSS